MMNFIFIKPPPPLWPPPSQSTQWITIILILREGKRILLCQRKTSLWFNGFACNVKNKVLLFDKQTTSQIKRWLPSVLRKEERKLSMAILGVSTVFFFLRTVPVSSEFRSYRKRKSKKLKSILWFIDLLNIFTYFISCLAGI